MQPMAPGGRASTPIRVAAHTGRLLGIVHDRRLMRPLPHKKSPDPVQHQDALLLARASPCRPQLWEVGRLRPCARLSPVAPAGHLPTAFTPRPGARPVMTLIPVSSRHQ